VEFSALGFKAKVFEQCEKGEDINKTPQKATGLFNDFLKDLPLHSRKKRDSQRRTKRKLDLEAVPFPDFFR